MESNKTLDYSKTAVLEKNVNINLPSDISNVKNKVKFLNYSNNKIACKVETEKSGILVLSEIWYPDWHPYIDGKLVELLKANYSFRAVVVPEGTHSVEMRYESSKFVNGFWMSITAIIVSIAGLFIMRKE